MLIPLFSKNKTISSKKKIVNFARRKKVKSIPKRPAPQPILLTNSLQNDQLMPVEEKESTKDNNNDISSKESTKLFIQTMFPKKYNLYQIHEVLQEEGRRIALDKNLNNQSEENNTGIVIRISDKNYTLFCNLDNIKSLMKSENKRYVNSENVHAALQYCINNVGFLIPFIIERARYEVKMSKQIMSIESNILQELDIKSLAYEIPIIDEIKDSFVFIIFQSCVADPEVFYKIMTLLLYELTKNKKADLFVKKNLLSKMIDFIIRLLTDGLSDNITFIKKNIEKRINEMAILDDFYKMDKILLYDIIYRIIKYPFVINTFLNDSYFLFLLQSSYQKNDLTILLEKNDNGPAVQTDNKSDAIASHEKAKDKQVLDNIKNMFIKNNNE